MSYDEVRVLIVPRDYGRSLRFWTEGVGLDVHEAFADDAGVLLTLGRGVHLELLAAPPGGPELGAEPGPGRLQLSVRVADAGAEHTRRREAGLEPSDPVDQPWGHRSFEVVDPDGHRLTLFEVRDVREG